VNHDPVTKRLVDEFASSATAHDATLTKPGSLAATYGEYEATFARSEVATGNTVPTGTVTKVAGGIWLMAFPGGQSYTFSAFQYDVAGRITTFSVNSRPLAGRLARGDNANGGGVTLSNVISHQSASGETYVTFDARNGSNQQMRFGISSIPPGFTLIGQSGQQYQSVFELSLGIDVLQPGAASSYAIGFHAPDHGKQFRIELRSESDSLTPIYAATSLHRVS
jgi:hypothetical protein